jgi:type II secretory pathway pseudopilin PulG
MMKYPRQAGFTLVQVVVSIAIFAMLLLAMNRLFSSLYREQRISVGILERMNNANRVLAIMGEELRPAHRSKAGDYLLSVAEPYNLVFFSDIDADGEMEKVRYYLEGAELKKTVVEPGVLPYYSASGTTTVVSSQIVSGATPIFTYYDANYIGTGSALASPVFPTDVRIVGIYLELDNPDSLSAANLTVSTKVRLRNAGK